MASATPDGNHLLPIRAALSFRHLAAIRRQVESRGRQTGQQVSPWSTPP